MGGATNRSHTLPFPADFPPLRPVNQKMAWGNRGIAILVNPGQQCFWSPGQSIISTEEAESRLHCVGTRSPPFLPVIR